MNDVTLGARESHVVEAQLSGILDECEAICMGDSVKVNNISLEDALYSITKTRTTSIPVHNTSPHTRVLRRGTNPEDFYVFPTRVGMLRSVQATSLAESLQSD